MDDQNRKFKNRAGINEFPPLPSVIEQIDAMKVINEGLLKIREALSERKVEDQILHDIS